MAALFKICSIAILFVVISFGCIREEESGTNLEYRNESTTQIRIEIYPSSIDFRDTLWLQLNHLESIKALSHSEDGAYENFQKRLFPVFASVDSALVIFSDSLSVTHYSVGFSRKDSSLFSEDAIKFRETGNIFNPDYFVIEKVKDNFFKATYVFTENDLEYAIQINE